MWLFSLYLRSFLHLVSVRTEVSGEKQTVQGRIQDFLKGGSYVKMGGEFDLLILSHFSEISHENKKNGRIETKLFHFYRIFKNGGQRGGFERSPLVSRLTNSPLPGRFDLEILFTVQYVEVLVFFI